MAPRQASGAPLKFRGTSKNNGLSESSQLNCMRNERICSCPCSFFSVSMDTHYSVLNVAQSASTDQIKQRFQQLIMQHHPDKQGSRDNDEYAQKILQAWDVLRDVEKRKAYDIELQLREHKTKVVINEEVDLDEMDYDEEKREFQLLCRCSGTYTITEDELEDGIDTVTCNNCSLRIRVLYEEVQDDDDAN
ncbi:DnaJ domain-containing protein [Gongronella butleri]|nr:DnaJ domain-containing protein [Gongronella butleri]